MSKPIWSASAISDLESIREYIGQFNPTAAAALAARIIAVANSLEMFPSRGRMVGGGDQYRELLAVYPYIIRYENIGPTITILGIRHGMRDEPEG